LGIIILGLIIIIVIIVISVIVTLRNIIKKSKKNNIYGNIIIFNFANIDKQIKKNWDNNFY